jgi:hypothetical protein
MPPRLGQLPSPWIEFVHDIDRGLTAPIQLHCLGGFVLSVLYGMPRPTDDLDYISIVPQNACNELQDLAGFGSRLCKKHKVFLQHAGGVADFPENYEDRLAELDLGLSKLSLQALDPYDLLLAKLTRNSAKDREDVHFLAVKPELRFDIFVQRYESEMKAWVANADRHNLTVELWRSYFPQ